MAPISSQGIIRVGRRYGGLLWEGMRIWRDCYLRKAPILSQGITLVGRRYRGPV
ncbi:hypothetical protein FOXYSP1_18887 [Fusarium oxysporum f. sp. phaseoli]